MKRRSDFGTVVLTNRDINIFLWMGEQYAIRFDHLQILAGGLSYKAAYRLSTRWVKAGYVIRQKIFVSQPMWLWLTAKGLKAVGLDVPYHTPAISRLTHIHTVNSVRLHIENRVGEAARWIGEREANALRKLAKKKHLVDGELEYGDGHVVGIEVELTQKRKIRLNNIIRELKRDYDTVWYFVAPECYGAVQRAIEQIPNHEETFILHPLSSIIESSGSGSFQQPNTVS